MYIKQIQLQNFQTIKEFSGDFEGNVYFVTGENELGKSTLLKAIMVLLTGNRDEVLRNGEDKGFAKIVVGDDGNEYEVELRMTKANPRGTITIKSNKTGLKSDRITALQDIFGYQDFDANEFVSWSETAEGRRKQVKIVKSLLPEQTQKRIAEIDTEVLQTKEARKDDNATLKTYSTIFSKVQKGISEADLEQYSEPIDLQDLLEQQQRTIQLEEKAKSVKDKLELREKAIKEIPERISELDKKHQANLSRLEEQKKQAEIERNEAIEKAENNYKMKLLKIESEENQEKSAHEQQLSEIKAEEADSINRRNNCLKWLKDFEENKPEDVSEKIKNIQHHNEMSNKVAEYYEAKQNMEDAEASVNKHEEHLQKLYQERETLIKESSLPIKGLNFTDEGLVLNDIPFISGKVSDSQIMEVAAKLIIAKNPTVKVFRIARGESLGKKRLDALISLAKKEGFQGFIEQVVREQNELRVEQYSEVEK